MAQPDRRQFYTDNGAAAYDIYSWNDSAARRYEDGRAYEQPRRQHLPEEQVREQPYRRVKAKTAIAPFTLAGQHATEIGLTKCQPEQIVYVSFTGTDQAEIYHQQHTSVFGEILDAMQQSILGLIEYLHPTAA